MSSSSPALIKIPAPDIFYYHWPCPDGLACRLVAEDYFGPENKIDFREWIHGKAPDFTGTQGKTVWLCDVVPTVTQLKAPEQLGTAKHVDIKDHHDNPTTRSLNASCAHHFTHTTMELEVSGTCCGALMLHKHLFPNKSIPLWLDAVNKGDTNLILKRTAEEKGYHAWITRSEVMASNTTFRKAIAEELKTATESGIKLLAQWQTECEQAFKELSTDTCASADGKSRHAVGYVRASSPQMIAPIFEYVFAHLSKPWSIDFLVIRWSREGVKQLSLRSPPGSSFDVSAIARLHGGNGHPAASGIQDRENLE